MCELPFCRSMKEHHSKVLTAQLGKQKRQNCLRGKKRLYRVAQKIWHHFSVYALTVPNINRFSKLFHCQNKEKICNNTVAKDPTTPQVCRYTTLWNVIVLKATLWNSRTQVVIYRVGQKPRPLYIFATIHQIHFSEYLAKLKLQKIILRFFAHIKTIGVSRLLALRKDKRCVCGTRGQGQHSILVMRGFWSRIFASVQGAAKTSGLCSKTARAVSHRQKQLTWKCHLSSRTWHCDHQTIWIRWKMLFGECFRRWFTTAEVKSVQELKKCNSRCVATTVTSIPWPKY